MTVPYFHHSFVRRSASGPKAHAHAAYLSGTKLTDQHGATADYSSKQGVMASEVWTPKGAPLWAKDRGSLWRNLELREDRTTRPKQALLAHKFVIALPSELSPEEMKRLVHDYVRQQFTRKGYAADWAIHHPSREGDQRNYHVHIMVPLRIFEHGTWSAKKDRFPKNAPALSLFIKQKQAAYFELQNAYLERNDITTRIRRIDGKWRVVEATLPVRPDVGRMRSLLPHDQLTIPVGTLSNPWTAPIKSPAPPYVVSVPDRAIELGQPPQPVTQVSTHNPYAGWPLEAVTEWKDWGHRVPHDFFAKWPELSQEKLSPLRPFR